MIVRALDKIVLCICLLTGLSMPSVAAAQAVTEINGIKIQTGALPITLDDRNFNLAVRVFNPQGGGPFPLVVINHGTPVSISDARSVKLGFTQASEWFARHGYIVVVALRPGFGNSDGPYMEPGGPCGNRDYASDGRETAKVEAAIVASASRLPNVDQSHIIVIGQSAGGYGAIALGDSPPPGVLGIISFAGGRGGDDHEDICGGKQRLIDATGILGKSNQVPQLWLFAANDHFFPPALGHAMFDAYKAGSKAPVTFVDLPAFGKDGHQTFGQADPSVWAEPVDAFLKTILRH